MFLTELKYCGLECSKTGVVLKRFSELDKKFRIMKYIKDVNFIENVNAMPMYFYT